jgi:hypothetical protein
MPERKIASRKEDLPPLRENYARVVHLTKVPDHYIEKIKKEGLDYSRHGMLRSTAASYSKEEEVDYSAHGDPRFSGEGTKAIVMDVPFDELRLHESVSNSPGKVPSKYIVGVIDVSKEKSKKSLEKRAEGSAAIISLFLSLFFLSVNLTGNFIGINPTSSNWIGVTLFIIGLVGAIAYFKK